MKKVRNLLLSIVLCLSMVGRTAVVTQAEEMALSPMIGGGISQEASVNVNEASIVSASTEVNISGYKFDYTDVRTPSNTRIFNGGDGKYHILLYGGIGSCGNTNNAIHSLSKLAAYMDLNQVEINAFDVVNNTSDTVLSTLTANNVSSDIKVCKSIGDRSMYAGCISAAGITNVYTMPMMIYVNNKGDIVKTTTGYVSMDTIKKNIESMGLKVDVESSYQVLDITGTVDYKAAFEVLKLLNEDRAKAGLSTLTMDPGLLESAMQRAAETSLYFSHTRPNEESCFSLDSKMYRENIAAGHTSAKAVQESWMNSTGHNANIMATDNKSVGIGVFKINGVYYWVQCFGNGESVNASQPANAERTYSIQTVQQLVEPYFKQNTFALTKKDETAQFEIVVKNKGFSGASVLVNGSAYNWSSDNANFVFDAKGKMTAKKWGSANIMAVNKNNSNYKLYGSASLATNITVSNPGIYVSEVNRNEVVAGMTYKTAEKTDMEYTWYASKDSKNWTCIQDWKENNEWIRWKPATFGEYTLKGFVRVQGNQKSVAETTVPISFHPQIKGKCQMPYTGKGGGYLIGVETYDNPNQSYQYEMLILDCTLLAQGKDAWIYTTGKCGVAQGNALWTIWQPQYGYYWTLFRVYDAEGNMLDEVCYGFQNI